MNEFRYERTYRGPIKAVIFDWAGTTVDYGCMAPAAVFVEVFRRQGVEITVQQAREPMGAHKKDHIRQISQMPEVVRCWQEAQDRACEEKDVEAMYQEFIPLQLDSLSDHGDIIPGTLETVEACRDRGLKVGSTTGYSGEMMDILQPEAAKGGYKPDATISATDVPVGRPAPWMCFANAQQLDIYPMESIVKVGDTLPDIEEGLNAGMWSIGVVKTGNEFGLTEKEVSNLPPEVFAAMNRLSYARMHRAGAHYVVDSIADIMPCLDEIEERLNAGEKP